MRRSSSRHAARSSSVIASVIASVITGVVAGVVGSVVMSTLSPGTAAALHVDITGVPSCLASNGTYSVAWSVTVPNDGWAQGFTVSLAAPITLTPSTVIAGQTSTGTGTGYAGSIASLAVTNTWSNGAVEINTGTVARPTTACAPTTTTTPATTTPATTTPVTTTPATTTPVTTTPGTTTPVATTPVTTTPAATTPVTTAPVTVPAAATPVDVCANLAGVQTSAPNGFIVIDGATCVLAAAAPVGTDVCTNIAGVQTAVPVGYVIRNGTCLTEQEAAALANGSGSAFGADAQLPATGRGTLLALIAVEFVCLGALALMGARRMQRNGTLPPALTRLLRFD